MPEVRKERIRKNWIKEKTPTIFYSDNGSLIDDVVNNSNTISLTQYSYISFFEKLSSNLNNLKKIVYLCKKIFESESNISFERKLLDKFNNWAFRLTLIDRYTLQSYKETLNDTLRYIVTVEDYPGKQVSLYHNDTSIHPSDIVHRPQTDLEFEFHVKEFQLLREGIYQYYKYMRQKNKIVNSSDDCSDILTLFAHLQVECLIGNYLDNSIFQRIYGIGSRPELRRKLMNECKVHYGRLDNFYQHISLSRASGQSVNIKRLKEKNILVNDVVFYRNINQISYYEENPELIVSLMKDLQINPRIREFKTVFISYSFKDSKIASLIANYLIIAGVQVKIFEFDNPQGRLKEIMSQYIREADKVIFIASCNSIKSEACHFELEKCRERTKMNWENLLIPIRLDRSILDIDKHNIPIETRDQFWANIGFVKEDAIQDFSQYSQDIRNSDLAKDVYEKIILKYLMRGK